MGCVSKEGSHGSKTFKHKMRMPGKLVGLVRQ